MLSGTRLRRDRSGESNKWQVICQIRAGRSKVPFRDRIIQFLQNFSASRLAEGVAFSGNHLAIAEHHISFSSGK
jgi:hypothetical protein